MNKSIDQIWDDCTAQELDALLRPVDAALPDEASLERIQAKATAKAGISPRRRGGLRRGMLIAACLVALAALLVGCYVAEVAEYRRAVEFFDLNNLSTEGLSRGDIKHVWRDITTESLSYDKSLEVLSQKGAIHTVEGVDISIANYANNNALSFNSYGGDLSRMEEQQSGVFYACDTVYLDDDGGWSATVKKYHDGEQLWRADLSPQMSYINGYVLFEGAVFVYGRTEYDSYRDDEVGYIALLDDQDGHIRWQKRVESRYRNEEFGCAVRSGDTAAVFSCAFDAPDDDARYLVYRLIDADGAVLCEKQTRMDDLSYFGPAIALNSGYLVEVHCIYDYIGSDEPPMPHLLCVGEDGTIERELRFGSADESYHICDMAEQDGRVFLSVLVRPVDSRLYQDVESEEYGDEWPHYTEAWRDRAREEFSAMLFVFDPDSEAPQQFYTVGGAFADALTLDDSGRLCWSVQRILNCGYSPRTNSFSIAGYTRLYRYTFDTGHNLLSQEKTDRLEYYALH